MAFNYTRTKNALREIAQTTQQHADLMARAKAVFGTSAAALAAMPSQYAGISSALNAEAAANPTDQALQLMQAEKDKMVADFQVLKSSANAAITALDTIDFLDGA